MSMKATYTFLALLLIIALGLWFIWKTPQPAGEESTDTIEDMTSSRIFALMSPAFEHGSTIPAKYTCDENRGLNPPLVITGVHKDAKSLVLLMDDPDVPKQLRPDGVFHHWTLFNIPTSTIEIPEGNPVGTAGANGTGAAAYTGPCPPAQYEPSTHRYFFRLYALDIELPLEEGATKEEVVKAMEGHVLEEAELMGVYKRK